MKKHTFLRLAALVALASCTEDKAPEVDWNKRLTTKVEPFVVEHYELSTTPDSSLVLYFNREIDIKEDAFISIHMIMDAVHYAAKPRIPIQTKDKKFVLKLPVPDSLSHRKKWNDGLRHSGAMMNLLRVNWENTHKIDQVDFSSTMDPMLPKFRFINGKLHPWKQDFLLFSSVKADKESDKAHKHPWRSVLLKNYEGSFDGKQGKQGDWKWFYGNGQILATATFKNDSLVEDLFIYDYKGHCIDTVLAD